MVLSRPAPQIRTNQRWATIWLSVVFSSFLATAYGFGRYLFPVMLPDMRVDLGFDYATAGTITALAQAGGVIAGLSAGLLASRIGPGRLVVVAMLLCSFALFGLSEVQESWLLAVLLTFLGALSGWVWVPMVQIIGTYVPHERRALVFGVLNGAGGYGNLMNGILVSVVLVGSSWRTTWVLAGVVSGMLSLVGFEYLRRAGILTARAQIENDASKLTHLPLNTIKFSRVVSILWPIMFLSGFACIPFQTYLSALIREEFGYSTEVTGQAWVLIGVVGIAGGIAIGAVADRIGIQRTAIGAALLLGLANIIISFEPNRILLSLALILFGVSFYGLFGIFPAYVSKRIHASKTVMVFGFGNVFISTGSIIGNFAGGLSKELTGTFLWTYILSAAAAALIMLLFCILPREITVSKEA